MDEGLDVVCMDNLITGSLENIESFFGRPEFVFVQHDVTNFIHVAGKLDYVLLFASPASPIDSPTAAATNRASGLTVTTGKAVPLLVNRL